MPESFRRKSIRKERDGGDAAAFKRNFKYNFFFFKLAYLKNSSEMRKTVWRFLKTLKIRLPCDSAGCISEKKNTNF